MELLVEKSPDYEKKLQKLCKKSMNFARDKGLEAVAVEEKIRLD